MNPWIMLAVMAVLAATLSAGGCARNAVEKRSASPTMSERFKQGTITGKVHDIGSGHVSIRKSDGDTMRVRVDDRTKMDRVAVGDQVKAYVAEDGYASTIQRIAD